MTDKGADWDRLGRYVAGELSPAEAGEVQRWLSENAHDDKVLAALAQATANLPASKSVDVEGALLKVKARIAANAPAPSWGRYLAWAAAAAIVVAVGSRFVRTSGPAASTVNREYSTGVGARDSIVLADGSRVILGPGTRIVAGDRDIELTAGEAFFVVVHDEKRPFTVRAGGAVIRDIGTEFSVHSDHQSDVRVVVREGSVELARGGNAVVLEKGDVGALGDGGHVVASRGAATDDDLAWTTGRLVFRDASMSEVAADLRRWYGVTLKVTDSALLKRHYNASFSTESPARVMDVIALALGARADRRGDTVYIRPVAPQR
jgi:transmembrane sensor